MSWKVWETSKSSKRFLFRKDFFKQLPKLGNIPLFISQVIDELPIVSAEVTLKFCKSYGSPRLSSGPHPRQKGILATVSTILSA